MKSHNNAFELNIGYIVSSGTNITERTMATIKYMGMNVNENSDGFIIPTGTLSFVVGSMAAAPVARMRTY